MFPLGAMNASELLRFVPVSRRSTSPTRQPSLCSAFHNPDPGILRQY